MTTYTTRELQPAAAIKAFEVRAGKKPLAIVPTLEDASRLQLSLFDHAMRSGGSIPRGLDVRDRDTGERFRVSQNGRVWRVSDDALVCESQYTT